MKPSNDSSLLVIAGASETLYVVAMGEKSWLGWLGGWMLPTLVGNVVGGTAFVAALNHAQVTSGEK